jgi:hypothetical protein
MTRLFVVALAFLAYSVPAFSYEEDPLDSPAVAGAYPILIKRTEKRDRNNNLLCGMVIRCLLPTEHDCRTQFKSEKDGNVYSVVYAPGHSDVKRSDKGSLSVQGWMAGDTRLAPPGVPAPIMDFVWDITGQLSFDQATGLFTYTQKQKATGVTASMLDQTIEAGGFSLKDITYCAGMMQVAP